MTPARAQPSTDVYTRLKTPIVFLIMVLLGSSLYLTFRHAQENPNSFIPQLIESLSSE